MLKEHEENMVNTIMYLITDEINKEKQKLISWLNKRMIRNHKLEKKFKEASAHMGEGMHSIGYYMGLSIKYGTKRKELSNIIHYISTNQK